MHLQCPFTEEAYGPIITNNYTNVKINTYFERLYRLVSANLEKETIICEFDPQFQEFGSYEVHIKRDVCDVQVEKPGVNIYFRNDTIT